VAEVVRDTETLDLLHAVTEADALATGPAAWSTWRASLVADLAKRVTEMLAAGEVPEPVTEEPTVEAERLAIEAARTGGPVIALRAQHDPNPEQAATDGGGATPTTRAEEPVGVELLLAVPDRPGLLAEEAGVFALHRLTVRTADIRSIDPIGQGPITLVRWRVAAEYGSLPEAARLRKDLERAFDGSLDIESRLAERERAYPRRRGITFPPPRVTVAPGSSSDLATVIEVRAHDAPGLLHRIGRALELTGVNVRSARISTLGANAVDAFYVTGADGSPLSDVRATEVAKKIEAALR
jgi:[protein-PII] uridylyltransferase